MAGTRPLMRLCLGQGLKHLPQQLLLPEPYPSSLQPTSASVTLDWVSLSMETKFDGVELCRTCCSRCRLKALNSVTRLDHSVCTGARTGEKQAAAHLISSHSLAASSRMCTHVLTETHSHRRTQTHTHARTHARMHARIHTCSSMPTHSELVHLQEPAKGGSKQQRM